MSDLHVAIASSAFVIEFAVLIFVAVRISGWACREEDGWTPRIVVGLVVGVTQVVAVELFLGAVVALYAPVVFCAHVLIAVVVGYRVPRNPGWRRPRVDGSPSTVALVGVLALAGGIAALFAAKFTPNDSDDVTYHLPNAASWVQLHDLWHLPATSPGLLTNGYPSDGELVVSWMMQLFRGAELVGLPNVFYGALILAAAGLLAKELGVRPATGVLPAAALLLAPISWSSQVPTALTDWISLAGLLAGFALLLHGRARGQWRWPILAGLALGLAVGSKDTAVIPCLGVLVVAALIVYPRPVRWRVLTLLIGGIAGLAGIWFLRDAIQAGNPIYPEPVVIGGTTVFRGGTGPFTPLSTSLLHDLVILDRVALRNWLHWVRVLVGIPILMVVPAVLSFQRRYRSTVLPLCTVLAAVWLLTYVASPYTGPRQPTWMSGAQVRYGFPALFVLVVCGCVIVRWMLAVAWVSLAFDLYHIYVGKPTLSFPPRGAPPQVVIAGGVVIAVVAMGSVLFFSKDRNLRDPPTWLTRGAAASIAGGLAVVAVALGVVHERRPPSRLDVALTAIGRPSGTVMLLGVEDEFAVMGYDLHHRLVGGGGGGATHQLALTVPELNARVASVDPAAIIVGPAGTFGVPPGWTPKGYRLLLVSDQTQTYIVSGAAAA